MSKKKVLIVDDELNIRRILSVAFEKAGWHALAAEHGQEALAVIEKGGVDCVLTDVTMPGMSGYQLQETIAERWPGTPVVIMTAFGTIPQAVRAIRNGAFEYVTKPFDLDVLKKVIGAALEQGSGAPVKAGRKASGSAPKVASAAPDFVCESPEMREVYETIQQVADSRATVLVTGESGTGKEVVAKLLHTHSPRSSQAFVAVNCAALPDTLLESELFGYEKGAFTGADQEKKGRFELASGGTLFLDEIGDVPALTQVKLLRVLQEREFERLGATTPTKVDVRLVTATNRDLAAMVEEGTFRLDLLYRLQVVEIRLPALRERPADVLPLVRHFLAVHSAENGRELTEISAAAERVLLAYPWPGNVRELVNMMERAVVLAKRDERELELKHLPRELQTAA